MPIKSYLSVDLASLFSRSADFRVVFFELLFSLSTPILAENVNSHYVKSFSYANFPSVFLPVCLSVVLPILSSSCLSFSLSVFRPVCLSPCLSFSLSAFRPVCLSSCLSFALSIFLPVCLLPVCISLCLSYSSFLNVRNVCSSVLEF
jgi:hypothetical protein